MTNSQASLNKERFN